MVQDMLEVEYYVSEIGGLKTHFRDFHGVGPDMDGDDQGVSMNGLQEGSIGDKLVERQPLVVVPMPFSAGWFASAKDHSMNSDDSIMSDVDSTGHDHNTTATTTAATATTECPTSTRKRGREPDPAEGMDTTADSTHSKRNTQHRMDDTTHKQSLEWWPSGCMESDPDQCPVIAKMYYEQTQGKNRKLRLNDAVEFIAVLSFDPTEAIPIKGSDDGGDFDEEDMFMMYGEQMVLPPPSVMPRLHVLDYHTLELETITAQRCMNNNNNTSNNDFVHKSFYSQTQPQPLLHDMVVDNTHRATSIKFLANALFGGDMVVGEALLLSLLSMAERERIPLAEGGVAATPVRTPDDSALGCASLRILLPNKDACAATQQRLVEVLHHLIPVVGDIRLADNISTLVAPAKTETGKLRPSPLQCPRGSAFVINEAGWKEDGTDKSTTTRDCYEFMEGLRNLTGKQSVPYKFEGGIRYNLEADYRVVVLSTNGSDSNGLPCNLAVHCDADNTGSHTTTATTSTTTLSIDETSVVREYLSTCRTVRPDKANTNVAMGRAMLKQAQKDFVERRVEARQCGGTVGETEFHRWLTLTRLQARSLGCTEATVEHWNMALLLDDAIAKKTT